MKELHGEYTAIVTQTRFQQWSLSNPKSKLCNSDRWFLLRWQVVSQGIKTGRTWSYKKRAYHISHLELLAIKLALIAYSCFTEYKNFNQFMFRQTTWRHCLIFSKWSGERKFQFWWIFLKTFSTFFCCNRSLFL